MKKLNTFLLSVLFLFATLIVSTSLYASHILAVDLYYTWVSGNIYKITVVLYGDCSPASSMAFGTLPSAQPQVCVFRGNTNVTTINLNIEAPSAGVDISPVCPSEVGQTQCENPSSTIPGIKQFVYSFNYTLPSPVSGVWQFAYFGNNGSASGSGRSVNTTNIVNPSNSVIELVDTLDNTIYSNNSSAQFSVIPTPFFCLNLPDSYNPGAIAPAGDSLSVVNLITAMDASAGGFGGPCQFGNPVTYTGTAWNPPFTPISPTTPLNVVAGSYSYDVTTGQLNFTPNQIQRSTVVYNVREFRGGSFVGSSQREMNFLVQSCVATPPTGGIAGVSNGIIVDSAHLTTCANSGPFSFYFDPREPGTTNDITVTSSALPAGSTLNVTNNGTTTPHAVFSWTSTGVAPGTYIFYLTYTDNNCPLQGTITTAISVTVLPTATVNYSVITPITCSPKEFINIIPAGTGSPWTVKVTGTTTQIFTGVTGSFTDSLPSGIDTISISSPSSVSSCDSSAIIVIPNPLITGDTPVCAGSKIILSDAITGGTWSSNNTSLATVVATGSASGTVTGVSAGNAVITYSFPGGCFKTATVTVKPLPSAITGTLHACTGLTTTLSDALSGGAWSSASPAIATIGSGTGIVTGVTAGIAVISYTDNGCSTTNSVIVNKEPAISAGSPNICTDGTTTLTATPGGGAWSLNSTSVATITPTSTHDSAVISGLGITAGTTIVTYTLSGCTTTNTINTVHVLPSITGPAYVCTGQSITMSDAVTGGTWTSTNTSFATADAHAGVIVGVSPGVPTISYTIGGTCITSTTITVRQSPNHGAITGLSNVCVGQIITLSDTISGGAWTVTNDSATVSRDSVSGVFPGRDTVMYIVHDSYCRDTTTKAITIYSVPIVSPISGLPTLCVGTVTTLSDTARGGVWSSLSTTIATITSSGSGIVTGLLAGADTIEYTLSNPGCSTIATYSITVYNVPVPGLITGFANVCAGAVFTLSDTTGGLWSSSNVSIATIGNTTGNVSALNAGTTTIHYTIGPNAGRCYGDTTFILTVTPQNTLTINSTVTQVTCYGNHDAGISVVVSGGTGYLHYQWSNSDTIPVLTGLAPGFDTLLVTEPSRLCRASDTFQITQPDSLQLSDTTTQNICKKGNGTITTIVTGGTQPYTYLWSDNSTGANLENLQAGTYSVTVTDHNGCTQSLTAEITDNDCIINVHDAITPNGDGINDTWVIEGIDNYPTSTVQVFDKWGDMVFSKTGYNNDWSGQGKGGIQLPDGTYFYVVKLNTANLLGKQNTWTGSILIKR